MMLRGFVLVGVLALATLSGWSTTPPTWRPVWPVTDCWNCDDCGNGSHEDLLPFLEDGESMGGTFVNMCNIAYSRCPGTTHEPCQQTDDQDGLTFSIDRLDALAALAERGSAEELDATLKRFSRFARFNEERRAIEVVTCDGVIYANLPVTQHAIAVSVQGS